MEFGQFSRIFVWVLILGSLVIWVFLCLLVVEFASLNIFRFCVVLWSLVVLVSDRGCWCWCKPEFCGVGGFREFLVWVFDLLIWCLSVFFDWYGFVVFGVFVFWFWVIWCFWDRSWCLGLV